MSSESLALQALNIAPVKSLGLSHPTTIHVSETGIVEDRRFHVIDAAGRLMTQRQIGRMVQVKAKYQLDPERLSLTFPDGSIIEETPEPEDTVRTFIFGRMVGGRVVGGGFGEALSHFCDAGLRLVKSDKPGQCQDSYPISITVSGIAGLSGPTRAGRGRAGGRSPMDNRRFRPNFLIEAGQSECRGWGGGGQPWRRTRRPTRRIHG